MLVRNLLVHLSFTCECVARTATKNVKNPEKPENREKSKQIVENQKMLGRNLLVHLSFTYSCFALIGSLTDHSQVRNPHTHQNIHRVKRPMWKQLLHKFTPHTSTQRAYHNCHIDTPSPRRVQNPVKHHCEYEKRGKVHGLIILNVNFCKAEVGRDGA